MPLFTLFSTCENEMGGEIIFRIAEERPLKNESYGRKARNALFQRANRCPDEIVQGVCYTKIIELFPNTDQEQWHK